MEVQVWSIKRTAQEAAKWPTDKGVCDRCGEEFAGAKIGRDADGKFYHYNGCKK